MNLNWQTNKQPNYINIASKLFKSISIPESFIPTQHHEHPVLPLKSTNGRIATRIIGAWKITGDHDHKINMEFSLTSAADNNNNNNNQRLQIWEQTDRS